MSAARNTPTRGRFVWIGEYESIERLGAVEFARLVTKRRAEAPADAVEAVRDELINLRQRPWPSVVEVGYKHPPLPAFEIELIEDDTRAVLRALGGFPLETT